MARSGRQDRNRKLRAAFISQTAGQLRELAALLDGGGNGLEEPVSLELRAMAERAEALQLTAFGATCSAAADQVMTGAAEWSLRPVFLALEGEGLTRAFPPLVVVASEEDLPGLKERASQACEPLRFLSSTAPLGHAMQCDAIQGVLVPHADLAQVSALHAQLQAPVYVYGEGHTGLRLDAARSHAAGWVDAPIALDQVLRRQRRDTWRHVLGKQRVLLVADEGPRRSMGRLLSRGEGGPDVRPVADPTDVVASFIEFGPTLVILQETTGGVSAQHSINLLRTHDLGSRVPVLVLGEPDWAEDYPFLQCYGNAASLAESVRMVLSLTHSGAASTDLVTGVQSRPVVLEALDREMARARRSQRPVTVGAVGVDQLAAVRESYGSGAADRGLRVAASVLQSGVRLYDLVGRVTADTFMVCLPECSEPEARPRLDSLRQRFAEAIATDPELSGLSWSIGITDSERGPAQVLRRVDDALEEARSRG